MKNAGRLLLALLASLVALVGGLVALAVVTLLLLDWNWARGPLGERASAALGRDLSIDGAMTLDLLTTTPSLVAHEVRFANADWASDPVMAEIGRLGFQIDLLDLVLHWRLHVLGLSLRDGVVRLEKDAEGRANWTLGPTEGPGAVAVDTATPETRAEVPAIDRLILEDLRIVYEEPEGEPLEARFATLTAERTGTGIALETEGVWRDEAFAIAGTLGTIEILRGDAPYPVTLAITAGETRARIDGTVAAPLAFTGFDAAISLEGPSLDHLTRILGLPLPSTPQYGLRGHLTSRGSVWRLEDFAGTLGNSDLGGTLSVDVGGEVPVLDADVRSELLDFRDLAGLIGEDDVAGAPSGAAAGPDDDATVLPDDPFDLTGLRAVDGTVTIVATEIRRGGSVFQDVRGTVRLDGGRLVADPLELGFASGTLAGTLRVDAAQDTPRFTAELRVRKLDLGVLVGDLDPQQATWGRLSGRADLKGYGRSVHAIAATLDGEVLLYMGRGGIGNVLIEGMGLDVTEVIASLFSDDPDSPIECIILPLTATAGVLRGETMLLRAAQDTVMAEGFVDLGREDLEVRLRVYPHDFSLFNAPSVLTVRGTLGGDIGVNETEVVGEVIKKLLLAPLSPFFDTEEVSEMDPCAPVRKRMEEASPAE